MLYFTSDLHLCHKNIIKYARPQFEFSDEGLQQCEDLILKNYNDVITDDDIVVFLGDIAFLKSEFKPHISEYCHKLKGRKLMLRGNHDTITDKFFLSCGFEKIIDYILFENIFICHYPLSEPDSKREAEFKEIFEENNCNTVIHGHIHSKEPDSSDGIVRFNMCVDYAPNHYSPVLFNNEELEHYILNEILGEIQVKEKVTFKDKLLHAEHQASQRLKRLFH